MGWMSCWPAGPPGGFFGALALELPALANRRRAIERHRVDPALVGDEEGLAVRPEHGGVLEHRVVLGIEERLAVVDLGLTLRVEGHVRERAVGT